MFWKQVLGRIQDTGQTKFPVSKWCSPPLQNWKCPNRDVDSSFNAQEPLVGGIYPSFVRDKKPESQDARIATKELFQSNSFLSPTSIGLQMDVLFLYNHERVLRSSLAKYSTTAFRKRHVSKSTQFAPFYKLSDYTGATRYKSYRLIGHNTPQLSPYHGSDLLTSIYQTLFLLLLLIVLIAARYFRTNPRAWFCKIRI